MIAKLQEDGVLPGVTMAKTISYLKKGPFEGKCHPLGCGNKNARRRNDAFRLWDHLTVIIYEEDCKKTLKVWVLLRTLKVLLRTLKVLQDTHSRRRTIKINDC